ncbi:uncharacterized protein Z520_01798 [Fonsecaea multimorphosa CBS 102226]|uniref:Uncharacterized protein n=1 Tax=Fonsecaea multimorphosa CBS 102226 TaxID=1442371 RepID=A0A0D2HIB5_9EURO|nr:uncharacterized protein Z520_01798 [Fonsecaea multimorphosa CBS 102226]KIY01661.1 hypothetical protein Z520_01798 [Fonsecaea multimorphosa CBS 102226]OAL29856.1 hypothetical protein AYO22_01762 [Fonsecaea multimorphosa]
MATEISDETWKAFLDQHNSLLTLLDSHASLLAEMRKFCLDNSQTLGLLQDRLNATENLIATFKLSAESLTDITKREEQVPKEDAKVPEPEILNVPIPVAVPKPKPQLPAEPILDPSGFFAVDTNPTPIEQLYKQKPTVAVKAKDGPKRKASGEQLDPNSVSENEPVRKKPKQSHKREAPVIQEEDDSFVKRVEARSRAKEERKKARLDKKRKRQSGDSTGSVKAPENKKQKKKDDAKVATANPSAATHADPQMQNGKRPHPEPNSDGTNGRASKRGRRGKK